MKIAEISELKLPSDAQVSVPGSKSYSLRALFIAALCDSPPELNGLLESQDTKAMQDCLKDIKAGESKLSAGESGITARFITALACIAPGRQEISGEPGLLKRPIADLVKALRQLGAVIEYLGQEGFLPIAVSSGSLSGEKVTVSGGTSSQYLSALLLIAPVLKNGLEIDVEGELISKPYVDMTLDIMSSFGVDVQNGKYQKYSVKPQRYERTNEYKIEGDYSSASYFYAINALTGSNIKVENLNLGSKQADKQFVDLIKTGEWHGGMDSRSDEARFINAQDFPDQAMTLAVLAAFREGKTVINGVKSLRVKETERVKALENELAKMGINTESAEDTLTIYGGKPKPATIDTYNDHRIAMSFAVAGMKAGGMKILRPQVVSKTFPDFWDELSKITEVKMSESKPGNILLIGMRGSGKSTTGRKLAEKLQKRFIELDDLIVERENKSVPEIVASKGWEYFRDIESEAIRSIADEENTVISSGGGIVLRDENISLLKSNSTCIFLRADIKVMEARTASDPNRPALTKEKTLIKEIESIYAERKDKFYEAADFIIDTSTISPGQVVNEIMEKLK